MGLIRIRIVSMGFDQNLFNGVIIEFLSASVKNVDEIETCWRQMQASIGNMFKVVVER